MLAELRIIHEFSQNRFPLHELFGASDLVGQLAWQKLGGPLYVGRDDRQAVRHCFDQRVGHPFPARREEKDLGLAQPCADIALPANQLGPLRRAMENYLELDRFTLGAIAEDRQFPVLVLVHGVRCGQEHRFVIFLWVEPSHGDEPVLATGWLGVRSRLDGVDIDPVGNDHELLFRHAKCPGCELPDALADAQNAIGLLRRPRLKPTPPASLFHDPQRLQPTRLRGACGHRGDHIGVKQKAPEDIGAGLLDDTFQAVNGRKKLPFRAAIEKREGYLGIVKLTNERVLGGLWPWCQRDDMQLVLRWIQPARNVGHAALGTSHAQFRRDDQDAFWGFRHGVDSQSAESAGLVEFPAVDVYSTMDDTTDGRRPAVSHYCFASSMTNIDQYDYHLPSDLIAQQPLEKRTDARLLVVNRQTQEILHQHVRDLPEFLSSGDCLVLNNTKVVPARLMGRRANTGGRWQGLFVETDPQGHWLVLAKTRGKIQPGEKVILENREAREDTELELLANLGGGQWAVKPLTEESPFDVLERVGRVPLPHYIRGGEMMPEDWKDYQTVFAENPGAVAAPTAGLHFTHELLNKVSAQGVDRQFVTLHVGMGTFRPIGVENIDQHEMHFEYGEINQATVDRLNEVKAKGGRLVSVGTTATRVLETAAASGTLEPWMGKTNLFIRPPYEFKAVDVLLTNFHLPKSTLLILVRTFGGDELLRRAYREAINEEYRFYSYGDAMLIL